jgi:lysophospholipase L1-like esterase
MRSKQFLLMMVCGTGLFCFAGTDYMKSIDDAEVVSVDGESAKFPVQDVVNFFSGFKPKKIRFDQEWGSVVPLAIDPDSVIVKQNDVRLKKNKDYIVDPVYGTMAFCSSTADTSTPVQLSYAYSLKRLDSLVRDVNGKEYVIKGVSELADPKPPELAEGETRIENIFVDSHKKGTERQIFPVTNEPVITQTTTGKIPRTMEKIESGKPVRIVFWGDSVTVGGDASIPERRFTGVTEKLLKQKFPQAAFKFDVIAVSGSGTVFWLFPEIAKHPTQQAECNFNRIIDVKPDLVVIEFVNDDYLNGELFYQQYDRILEEMKKIGSEIIFVAPHLTWPGKLGISDLRAADPRPYTALLKKFAADNNCALADVSGLWSQTWKWGIPYVTYLKNGVNHPDDRGHAMIAEEIVKCFE